MGESKPSEEPPRSLFQQALWPSSKQIEAGVAYVILLIGIIVFIIGAVLSSQPREPGDLVCFIIATIFVLLGFGFCCFSRGWGLCLLLFSIVTIVLGGIFGFFIPETLENSFEDGIKICSKSDPDYDSWYTNSNSEVTKFLNVYLFDLTNPYDYLDGDTAELHLVGPWVLREYSTKLNVNFHEDDTVTYQLWNKYIPYDGTVEGYDSRSCVDCDGSTSITNLNPGYLTLLGTAYNEALLFLSSLCTTTQIGYTLYGVLSDCSEAQRGTSAACRCCTMGTTCPDLWDISQSVAQLFSNLSYYDGGTAVSEGSKAYTPLVITKTLHELSFGYPSAFLGYYSASTYASSDWDSFEAIANYTEDVRTVCEDLCDESGCDGYVGDTSSLDEDLAYLSKIDCLPFSASVVAKSFCTNQEEPTDRCVCADGTNLTDSDVIGCCIFSGSLLDGTDMTGRGCMQVVTGYVDDKYYYYESIFNADNTSYLGENTGCSNIEELTYRTKYYGASTFRLWYNESNDFPSVDQISEIDSYSDSNVYISSTFGADATRFPQTGITNNDEPHDAANYDLSDGQKYNDTFYAFVAQVRRPIPMEYSENVEFKGIHSIEYRPQIEYLAKTESNAQKGIGIPYAGLAARHYLNGFYLWVSRPFFLYGNVSELLSQSNNEHLGDSTVGGGIELYLDYEPIQAFDGSNAAKYSDSVLVTEDIVDQYGYDYYDASIYVEPATGFTLRGSRNLQASFGLWGCDPSVDSYCYLGVGSGTCYNSVYPCSAANAFTPNVRGEKVIPAYFVTEFSEATDDDIDTLHYAGKLNRYATYLLVFGPLIGAFFFVLSIPVILGLSILGYQFGVSSPGSSI